MTSATARQLLRESRAEGFCGSCLVRTEPGALVSTEHARGCKIVNDAALPRRKR
jgi:NADH pyrophosphatase NudC (nudix superfamily)